MKRRAFLAASTIGTLVFVGGYASWWARLDGTQQMLGDYFRNVVPNPDETLVKSAKIEIEQRRGERTGRFNAQTVVDGRFDSAIRKHIKDEFAEGQVVELSGWILSETEVMILAALDSTSK